MRRVLLTLSALFCVAPALAHAQEYQTVLDIPAGHTLVNLTASEQVEVDQDLLVASLRFESKNKDSRALQNDINTAMKKALEKTKSYSTVKVSTEQYNIYSEEYDPLPDNHVDERETRWHGEQSLQLKSKNADDILKLAGELQGFGFAINGLSYAISPELYESTQESLLEAAIAKLKAKAERAAKALGKSQADLLEVDVDSGGNNYPQPMMAMARMEAAAPAMDKVAAPVAQAGQSQISLTVTAKALLKP